MKRTKWLPLLLLLLLLPGRSALAQADHLSAVKQNRVLYFGVAPDYFPFVYYSDQGELTGLDIDLMQEFCRRLGVQFEAVDLAYPGLVDALALGQVDVIGGALQLSDTLSEKTEPSRVYFRGNYGLLAASQLTFPQDFSIQELHPYSIGVEQGSAMDQFIKTRFLGRGLLSIEQVHTYGTLAQLSAAAASGEISLAMIDDATFRRQFSIGGAYQFLTSGWLQEYFVFATPKGSTLTAELNRQLNLMIADGTAQRIASQYAGRKAETEIPVTFDRLDENFSVAAEQGCVNGLRSLGIVPNPPLPSGAEDAGDRITLRVYNTGTCVWDTLYQLLLVNQPGAPVKSIRLSAAVPPGNTADISLTVDRSAEKAGWQRWQMISPEGNFFGQTILLTERVTGGISL